MPTIDPRKKRRALFGLLWLAFCTAALFAAMAWTDRKYPDVWPDSDPTQEKARELLEENYRENIRPHFHK